MTISSAIEDIFFKLYEAENVLDEAQSALSEMENIKNALDADF